MNKAIIMAGGFGTRLRPITCTTIKPMVPLMNKPMMTHIIELLKKHNIKDIIALLYFQPEQVTNYFGDGSNFGVKMTYDIATDDFGTAGAVKHSQKFLNEPFIVISGDVLTDFDLSLAIKYHKEKNALITIVLTRVENPLQYGVVITDHDGKITRFLEKPSWGEVFSDTVNTGIYIIEPKALDYIPENKEFDFSKDLFPLLLKNKQPLYGYIADGYWKDIGDLSEYLLAHRDVLDGKVNINIPGTRLNVIGKDIIIGENVVIEDKTDLRGGVVIGNNCVIKRGAYIFNSIIGDNCIVESNAKITGSIIWSDCFIGRNAIIKEAIVGKHCRIMKEAYLSEGVVVSDECYVGESANLKPNTKVWPHKVVEPGSTLSTSLIWGEKWNKQLFGANSISGLGNIEITPEFAAKVGAACGAYFGKQTNIATSRDSHKTSRLINRALISGILSSGCNVYDMQVMPPPVARYQLPESNIKCCIHTRKSPVDPKVIEIKFYDSNGMALSISKQKAIERYFFREDFMRAGCEETGTIHFPHRTIDIYCEGLFKFINEELIRQKSFKIVIDYAFGASSIVLPQILGQLGVEAISLNAYIDEKRLTYDQQNISNSLRQLSNIVQSLNANFGIMFDASCETIRLVDENGKILSDDMLLYLISYMVMKTFGPNIKIAVPVTISNVIEKMAKNLNCSVIRTNTMSRSMMETAVSENVVLVSDGLGNFGFPAFQPASDGIVTLCKILEMLAIINKPISEIEKEIPNSNLIKVQIPCAFECKGKIMRQLIESTKDLNVELIDGIKINFNENEWVLIIPDPDRPFFNLYVEAQSSDVSNHLIKTYSDKIKCWQKHDETNENDEK